ncbi:hypothetical protein [Acinetobacter ihumii]|uniref:hypothetical protein n=1 Tax=Acinetobacter ihumii TaxID=2483802 RepID=UPI001031DB94|nr:hypothetical protein [Acinetobacter ihumii]
MLKQLTLSAVLISGLVACHTFPHADSSKQIQVAKSLQGKQCEQQALNISELKQQLEVQHIHIYTESVGHDGMMRPQVCGAPDGKIAIFNIDQKQLAQAQALGFVIYSAQ